MLTPAAARKKNFFLKAIFGSFILHVFLLKSFIFTFSLSALAPKPFLVFLGSILERQDFTNLLSEKIMPATPQFLEALPVKIQQSSFDPGRMTSVLKPIFSGEVSRGPKEFLKSNFLKNPTLEQEWKEQAKDLGIELTTPKPLPLRL